MNIVLTDSVEKYLNNLTKAERNQVLKKINMAFLLQGRSDGDLIAHLEGKVNYIRRPGQHRLFFLLKGDMIIFFAYYKKSQKLPERVKEKIVTLAKKFL